MRGNRIRFNDFFTKTPKIPLYIQPFILKQGSNSNIVMKRFHSIHSMLLPNRITYGLFESLEREESKGEQREGKQQRGEYRRMVILHLVWMFLKLVSGKGVISHSSYLDVLKIRRGRRENDLNRQIYPYLKMDLQHQSMINLLD